MSSLISSTELADLVSGIRNHYETFASQHSLIVIKEPLQQIVDVNNNEYYGYGYQGAEQNYVLVPQSGIFNCMTYDVNSWKDEYFNPVPVALSKGDIIIKVESETKNYIDDGKTNLAILDGESFNVIGGPLPKNYGNQWYYYYSLLRTT